MMGRKNIFIVVLTLFFGIGCSTAPRIVNINMAHLYRADIPKPNPSYQIEHHDEQLSRIQLVIAADDLFYVRNARDEHYQSEFKVNLSVFTGFERKSFVRSAEFAFVDTLRIEQNRFVHKEIIFPLSLGHHYVILVEFEDLYRRAQHKKIIRSSKKTIFSEDFFYGINKGASRKEEIIGRTAPPFLMKSDTLQVMHHLHKDFTMQGHFFEKDRTIPLAPYVTQRTGQPEGEQDQIAADSLFNLSFEQGRAKVHIAGKGYYRFIIPEQYEEGFSVKSFGQKFPEPDHDEDFLRPLRYITSRGEFDEMISNVDGRFEALRFWEKITGNPDRAKSVMQRYNQRVLKANKLFSTDRPGWQTDRGMIYIIFGPPDQVYLNQTEEIWYYNATFQRPDVDFTFTKQTDRFNTTRFILLREQRYLRNWNEAVARWRR